jgi:hypothetical protein
MTDMEVPAAEAGIEVASEKMIPQSHVDAIVKREKSGVAEKLRREFEQQMQQMQQQSAPAAQNMGGMAQVDEKALEQKVYDRIVQQAQQQQEEAQQQEHKQAMENIANQYFLKMGKGPELFDDFKEIMADFEPASFPQVVFLAAEMENTPAVMYELSKNPNKLAMIDAMAQKSPAKARAMLKSLEASIAENQRAQAENVQANAPLSRLKSSTVGVDTGKMTLRDLKNAPFLRG